MNVATTPTSAAAPPPPRRRTRSLPWRTLAPILIVAAGVIAYANSLHAPFIFDDLRAIVNNPTIRRLWPITDALAAPPGNTFAARPVVNLSFALNYAMFGLDVRGYHVTNIAIHIAAALVLYGLLRRTLRLPRVGGEKASFNPDATALAITLLWEVHPMLTEVVTYTSTRTEGLMAVFFLLTFYCATRAFEASRPRGWYVAAVVACAVGMGCKEVMVGAPLLVYLYDALLVHGSFASPLRRRPVFYATLFATCLIPPLLVLTQTRLVLHTGEGLGSITPWQYLLTQSGVITHYLRLVVWPAGLTIDHFDWPVAQSPRDVWPYLLLIGALLALTAWGLVRHRAWSFAGAWIFVILAPTSSIVPLGSEKVAERRMYLPMIAIVTLAAVVAQRRVVPRVGGAVTAAVVGVLVVALTVATIRRNADYATAVSIWTDTVEKRPRDLRALSELARVLQEAGRHRDARVVAERVVAIDPTYPNAHGTLGAMLIGEGALDAAVAHLKAAVAIDPSDALARTNLGLALARQGQADAAAAQYREALRLDPDFVDAHVYLAELLAAQGNIAEARAHLEIALKLQPGAADIRAAYDRITKPK